MIYFLNKSLSDNKQLKLELTKIYGLNKNNILTVFNFLGINPTIKTKELKKTLELKKKIENLYNLESKLLKILLDTRTFELNIKTTKSLRKLKGLPVNGQRTKTNAKTTKYLFGKK